MKNNIKKLRKNMGLTLQQVADEMGVTRQMVSKWENHGISRKNAEKLAKVLRVEVSDLGINKKDLTEEINRAIEVSGLTKKQFARAIKTPSETINRWIRLKSSPTKKFLERIANVIGVSVDDFLNGNF